MERESVWVLLNVKKKHRGIKIMSRRIEIIQIIMRNRETQKPTQVNWVQMKKHQANEASLKMF